MGGRIALLIGTGSFGVGGLPRLDAPACDVRELAAALRDPYAGGFDTVLELVDASTQQVGREIARTLERCKRDDLVLLYFSGYALLDDEGQLHLAMRDSEPELLSPTSISAAFVAGEFERSRSRRQLVILDCCAGTGFAHGAAAAPPLAAPDAPRVASAFYAEGQPRAVFAACRRASGEEQIAHSPFTQALISGLRGSADTDGDGRITIDDLARYVEPDASAWLGDAVGALLIASAAPRSSVARGVARGPRPGGLISDRYRILSVIAEHGIGVLCSAIDERSGQAVSIKCLRSPESTEANTLSQFLREAGVAGAIGHPNLLTIRDVGFEHSTAFIVMDPLAGESLAAVLRRQGRLGVRETLEIALQASAAIAAAHAQRLVHRDLNPEHIFVGRNPDGTVGVVKVLGFGASTLLDANDVALAGALIGSPHYMAPEQVLGAGPPDVRADVYSLGAIMYEALTGHRPFEAENHAALLFKLSSQPPPPPTQWAADVPAPLEAVVQRAMARDPAQRFADVASLQDALHALGLAQSWVRASAPPPMAAEVQAVEAPTNTPVVFDRLPHSTLAPEPRRWPIALGLSALLAVAATAWLLTRAPQAAPIPPPIAASEPTVLQPEPAAEVGNQQAEPAAPADSTQPTAPAENAAAQPAAESGEPTEVSWRDKLRVQAAERRAAREARIQARLEAEEAARTARAEMLAQRAAQRQARAEAAARAKQERVQAAEAARQARAEAAAHAAAVRAATRAADSARPVPAAKPEPEADSAALAAHTEPAPEPAQPPAKPRVRPLPDEPTEPAPAPQPLAATPDPPQIGPLPQPAPAPGE